LKTGVESVDRMLGYYSDWPRHFLSGLHQGREAAGGEAPSGRIVACGMGTSRFAAQFALTMLNLRGVELDATVTPAGYPGFQGSNGTVIAVSFSGTTAETLSCARRALERGARLVAVTSGGELAGMAHVVVRLEPGKPQRTGLAEMVGAILGYLAPGQEWGEVAEALSRGVPDALIGLAETSAKAPYGVVAGCGPYGLAANRWRTEYAENAKMIVKSEDYPESGHNDLVAYQEKPGCPPFFVVLRDERDPFCTSILDVVSEIYSEHGPVTQIRPEGATMEASLLRAAQLAGMASVLTAWKRGVDPEATPILHRYREAVRRLQTT